MVTTATAVPPLVHCLPPARALQERTSGGATSGSRACSMPGQGPGSAASVAVDPSRFRGENGGRAATFGGPTRSWERPCLDPVGRQEPERDDELAVAGGVADRHAGSRHRRGLAPPVGP